MSDPPPTDPINVSVPATVENKKAASEPRLRWLPLSKTEIRNGEVVVKYPFLADDNFKDLFFVRMLMAERPYKSGYGATCKAWEECASQLSKYTVPGSVDLAYGKKPLKGKVLKERFIQMMNFVKVEDREALRRTGTDDEPEAGEIMVLLEDLYSDYKTHSESQESKTQSVEAQKKKDRNDAEAIRRASLGIYTVDEASDLEISEDHQTPVAKKRLSYNRKGSATGSSSSRSKSPVLPGSHNEALQKLMTRSTDYDDERRESKRARMELEIEKKEENNRRLSMELEEQKYRRSFDEERLKLEARRVELEEKKIEHMQAQQNSMHAQQIAMQAQQEATIRLLTALATKLTDADSTKK
jgi:hypothetical protein